MNEELEEVELFSEYQLIEYLQNSLISRATGGEFDNEIYRYIRLKIIKNKTLESFLPEWIKTCRDTSHFWGFIKDKYATYAERRKFIRDELSPLLNFLEMKHNSPIDEIIVFDEVHIHTQWQKAVERKENDPEGAITMARTLIESLLKHILDEENINHSDNMELSELYKKVAKILNLAPEQHQEQIFKQILGGANGIISGLGAMRNKLGDAHGATKLKIKPKERHSELAVNLAGSMAIFIYKTYKENF